MIYKHKINIDRNEKAFEKYEKLRFQNIKIQELTLETNDKINLKGWLLNLKKKSNTTIVFMHEN